MAARVAPPGTFFNEVVKSGGEEKKNPDSWKESWKESWEESWEESSQVQLQSMWIILRLIETGMMGQILANSQ